MIKRFLNSINNYEKISNIKNYIDKNYPGAEIVEMKSIRLMDFLQSDFEDGKYNCTLVSILRVLMNGIDRFETVPESKEALYQDIKKAASKYHFDEIKGTMPLMISKIIKNVASEYGLDLKSKGHYLGNFYNPIKREIDKNRPLIMNIGFGEYGSHSVTISGYMTLKFKGMKIHILEIYDNWTKSKRFIDYSHLAHSLTSLNAVSFNTIEIK